MNFQASDFLVLLVYLLGITLVGFFQKGKLDSYQNFFLGNKELPWIAIMLSIVATETSSLTFLSVPGMSYKGDFAFLQVALGYILGRVFVAYFILPLYIKGTYSSVYEWVGENFGTSTQKSMSGVFYISRVLADGVRLYVTSIPITFILQGYFPTSSHTTLSIVSLSILSFTTILYTVSGGFRAVVITDTLQFLVYIAGGVFALFFLVSQLGGIEQILSELSNYSEKFKIFQGLEGNFFRSAYFFPTAILGGMLLSIGSHGVDQMFAQRLLACKEPAQSQAALIGSGILVFFQFILFLMIGVLLFLFYKGANILPDQVFSQYMVKNIPSPILGLIVAAIFASAMSTLSSSINSLSLSVLVDWGKNHFSPKNQSKNSKLISLVWGVVLFLSALIPHFLSEKILESLLELGLKITSFTLGPMIGIFLIGIFYSGKKVSIQSKTLIRSLFLGILTVIIASYLLQPAFTLVIPIGILVFFIYLFLFQFINFSSK